MYGENCIHGNPSDGCAQCELFARAYGSPPTAPESPKPKTRIDELRELVSCMRELGVASAFGVVLGAEPPHLELLQAKAKVEPSPILEQEIREEVHARRVGAARDAIREKIGDFDMSDEACDRFIAPEDLLG